VRAVDGQMLLISPELLVLLMQRTGDGRSITVRELADVAGVHPSKIGFLRTGTQSTAPRTVALAIAKRLGVDELVLWAPTGRTTPALQEHHAPALAAVAQ
jgi:hypothetical protein